MSGFFVSAMRVRCAAIAALLYRVHVERTLQLAADHAALLLATQTFRVLLDLAHR